MLLRKCQVLEEEKQLVHYVGWRYFILMPIKWLGFQDLGFVSAEALSQTARFKDTFPLYPGCENLRKTMEYPAPLESKLCLKNGSAREGDGQSELW